MLHPLRLQTLHTSPDGTLHHHQELQSLPPDVQSLASISPDPNDGLFQRYLGTTSQPPQQQHPLLSPHAFGPHAGLPHLQEGFPNVSPAGYQQSPTRFDLIQASPQHIPASQPHSSPIHQSAPHIPHRTQELGPQTEYVQAQAQELQGAPVTSHGQFEGLKLIPNPPNLSEWRNKLFHVDDTITLTEEQQVHPFV
jgi:hypothetical protein